VPPSKHQLNAGRHRPHLNGDRPVSPRPPARDTAAPAATPLVGGRWRLESLLGRGGMSDVYRATDEVGTCGTVALKLVRTSEASFARRLAEEARALESFDHPGLVRLLAAGVHDGQAYLVTELVEGPTLADRLRDGPLSPARTATLAASLAGALASVHERGMVHRDIKPANVLLGPGQRVRLADFGIARLVDSASMTMTGTTLGTAAYMAPEQIEHHGVGTAADVWSLGLTLLECLIGARIFEGTPSEVVARRLAGSVQPPPDLPMPWRLVLAAMLEPSPERRPSASEVAGMVAGPAFKVRWHPSEQTAALIVPTYRPEPAVGAEADRTVPAGTPVPADEPATSVMPAVGAGPARAGPPVRRAGRRWSFDRRLIPLALVIVIAIALGSWAASGGGSPAHATNRPTAGAAPAVTKVKRSTTPTSTTTTVPTVADAAGALVRDVQTGITDGSIGPDIGGQLLRQLDQVLLVADDQNDDPSAVGNELGQIDALIADGASSSDISPTEASVLTADVAALSSALGASATTTPTSTTTTTAAAPPPAQTPTPAAGGPGAGKGHGQGPPGPGD
jgi:eukaryotic-like serine/threonine-protein kinase